MFLENVFSSIVWSKKGYDASLNYKIKKYI